MIEVGYILKLIVGGAFGYLFWSLRSIITRQRDFMTEKDVRQLLRDKLEVIDTRQVMLEKRLDKLDAKLDKILEKLSRG